MEITPEVVVGLVALFGVSFVAILMILKRAGIVKFTNGDHCKDHDKMCAAFKKINDEHIIQGELLKVHSASLFDGKKSFDEIKKDVANININIALLAEKASRRRSGDHVGIKKECYGPKED